MKTVAHGAAALAALKPLEVAAYLRAKGWRKTLDYGDKATLWLFNSNGEEFDLTLPLQRDLRDFALRMSELLQTLATVEERAQAEILKDIASSASDVIRIRVPNPNDGDGTLQLDHAVALVEYAREMIVAAACSALEKKPHYAARKPRQALDYLARVRMGQTEVGSYIITILSPVTPELRQPELPHVSNEPYERRVTKTLVEALNALDIATQTAAINGDLQPFVDAVNQGVSANFCDAVIGLASASNGHGIDIDVLWSQARPDNSLSRRIVRLQSDKIILIEEASRHFREASPVDDYELRGFVSKLQRGQSVIDGDVTVTTLFDDKVRNVSVRLDTHSYSQATAAHNDRKLVKCTGDLVKEGRSFRLQNPRHFQIVVDNEGG